MLVEVLNLLHIPSASTNILEADFKAVIRRGLNPDQKWSENIKAHAGCLAPSEDALVSKAWDSSVCSHTEHLL